jgi:hypothetical protein
MVSAGDVKILFRMMFVITLDEILFLRHLSGLVIAPPETILRFCAGGPYVCTADLK